MFISGIYNYLKYYINCLLYFKYYIMFNKRKFKKQNVDVGKEDLDNKSDNEKEKEIPIKKVKKIE